MPAPPSQDQTFVFSLKCTGHPHKRFGYTGKSNASALWTGLVKRASTAFQLKQQPVFLLRDESPINAVLNMPLLHTVASLSDLCQPSVQDVLNQAALDDKGRRVIRMAVEARPSATAGTRHEVKPATPPIESITVAAQPLQVVKPSTQTKAEELSAATSSNTHMDIAERFRSDPAVQALLSGAAAPKPAQDQPPQDQPPHHKAQMLSAAKQQLERMRQGKVASQKCDPQVSSAKTAQQEQLPAAEEETMRELDDMRQQHAELADTLARLTCAPQGSAPQVDDPLQSETGPQLSHQSSSTTPDMSSHEQPTTSTQTPLGDLFSGIPRTLFNSLAPVEDRVRGIMNDYTSLKQRWSPLDSPGPAPTGWPLHHPSQRGSSELNPQAFNSALDHGDLPMQHKLAAMKAELATSQARIESLDALLNGRGTSPAAAAAAAAKHTVEPLAAQRPTVPPMSTAPPRGAPAFGQTTPLSTPYAGDVHRWVPGRSLRPDGTAPPVPGRILHGRPRPPPPGFASWSEPQNRPRGFGAVAGQVPPIHPELRARDWRPSPYAVPRPSAATREYMPQYRRQQLEPRPAWLPPMRPDPFAPSPSQAADARFRYAPTWRPTSEPTVQADRPMIPSFCQEHRQKEPQATSNVSTAKKQEMKALVRQIYKAATGEDLCLAEDQSAATVKPAAVQPTHNASCDICGTSAIKGTRWRCDECPDFDCCEACHPQLAVEHPPHSFVPITDAQVKIQRSPSTGVLHLDVNCHHCDKVVVGPRYRCLTCSSYDLCSSCEALHVHSRQHPMIKAYIPLQDEQLQELLTNQAAALGKSWPINVPDEETSPEADAAFDPLARLVDLQLKVPGYPCKVKLELDEAGRVTDQSSTMLSAPELSAAAHSTVDLDIVVKQYPCSIDVILDNDGQAISYKVSEPQAEFVQPRPSPVVQPLAATFDTDVETPRGEVFQPGAKFTKGWRVLNTGTSDWPTLQLVQIAGFSQRIEPSVWDIAPASSQAVTILGPVRPGEFRDILLEDLVAPNAPGNYLAYFRLQDGEQQFGDRLWLDINVEADFTPDAQPTNLTAAESELHVAETLDIGNTASSNTLQASEVDEDGFVLLDDEDDFEDPEMPLHFQA